MAYFSQEHKKAIAPQVKAILAKYGLKGSLSVDNHSSVTLLLKSGKLAFNERKGYTVNLYWAHEHFSGVERDCIIELRDALNGKGSSIQNHDNSDSMTDYFDVGWYCHLNIGDWNKEYVVTA